MTKLRRTYTIPATVADCTGRPSPTQARASRTAHHRRTLRHSNIQGAPCLMFSPNERFPVLQTFSHCTREEFSHFSPISPTITSISIFVDETSQGVVAEGCRLLPHLQVFCLLPCLQVSASFHVCCRISLFHCTTKHCTGRQNMRYACFTNMVKSIDASPCVSTTGGDGNV